MMVRNTQDMITAIGDIEMQITNIENGAVLNEGIIQELTNLSADTATLKTALYERYFNNSIETVDTAVDGEFTRLVQLEINIQYRLRNLTAYIQQNMYYGQPRQQYQHTISEQLPQQPSKSPQKNNFERYIGLNILNTVGMILFIIGAFVAGQQGHIWITFTLGTAFLIVGEIMNRKRANVFSLGVTAGGVGILYAALALGHFVHDLISIYPALAICVAITALTFYLSTRYKAQTLLAITLVGGYFPILSILLEGGSDEPFLIFGMMAYFVLFNLLGLLVAFRNKWIVATFVGMSLNIIGMTLLSMEIWSVHPLLYRIMELMYIGFAMLVYNAIPIIGTYVTKSKFSASDFTLISINTFFGSIIMFANIVASGWGDFVGLALAIHAVVYLVTSLFIYKKFDDAKGMVMLFFITGIAFAFAFVLTEFRLEWFTPIAAFVTAVLTIFGILKDKFSLRIAGYSIGGLSIMWFLLVDYGIGLFWHGDRFFIVQYASVTAASAVILSALVIKNQLSNIFAQIYKHFVAINLWLFVMYAVYQLWDVLLDGSQNSVLSVNYLMLALMSVLTMIIGKMYSLVPKLADFGMKILGFVLTGLGLLALFSISIITNPVDGSIAAHSMDIAIIATVILVAVQSMGVAAVYDLCHRAVVQKIMITQFLPIIVSSYIVLIFTTTLTLDYGLSFASFWISMGYILTALIWIILGFVRRYAFLRHFGLVLAVFSVVKLFIFDLAFLTQEFRMISYFVMGAVLVTISFVYQFFSKRLDATAKEEIEVEAKVEKVEVETENEEI